MASSGDQIGPQFNPEPLGALEELHCRQAGGDEDHGIAAGGHNLGQTHGVNAEVNQRRMAPARRPVRGTSHRGIRHASRADRSIAPVLRNVAVEGEINPVWIHLPSAAIANFGWVFTWDSPSRGAACRAGLALDRLAGDQPAWLPCSVVTLEAACMLTSTCWPTPGGVPVEQGGQVADHRPDGAGDVLAPGCRRRGRGESVVVVAAAPDRAAAGQHGQVGPAGRASGHVPAERRDRHPDQLGRARPAGRRGRARARPGARAPRLRARCRPSATRRRNALGTVGASSRSSTTPRLQVL